MGRAAGRRTDAATRLLKEGRKNGPDQAIHTASTLLFLAPSSLIVSYRAEAAVGVYERRRPAVAISAAGAPRIRAGSSPVGRFLAPFTKIATDKGPISRPAAKIGFLFPPRRDHQRSAAQWPGSEGRRPENESPAAGNAGAPPATSRTRAVGSVRYRALLLVAGSC
jgi:hypothetical protein